MRILTTLALLLASFIPALGATTWPAGTNTANQTFFGNNNFLGTLKQNGVNVLTNLGGAPDATTFNAATATSAMNWSGIAGTNNLAPNVPQTAGSFLVWRSGTNAMWTTNLTWDGTTLTLLSNGVPVITLNTNGAGTFVGILSGNGGGLTNIYAAITTNAPQSGSIPYSINGSTNFTASTNLTWTGVTGGLSATGMVHRFAAGSTNTLVITNGNVGIGTTGPLATLNVQSANQVLGGAYNTYGNLLISSSDAMGADIGGTLAFGGNGFNANIYTWGKIHGNKENSIGGNIAGYLAFETDRSGIGLVEAMRINSLGNVGIGTTTPSGTGSANLTVTNSVFVGNSITPTNGIILPSTNAYIKWQNIGLYSPPTLGAGSAFLFSGTNILGTAEIFTMDGAGVVKQISEHAMDAPPSMLDDSDPFPNVSKEWNDYLGVVRWINRSREALVASGVIKLNANSYEAWLGIQAGANTALLANNNVWTTNRVNWAQSAMGTNWYLTMKAFVVANAAQQEVTRTETYAVYNARLGLTPGMPGYLQSRSWTSVQNGMQASYAISYTNTLTDYSNALAFYQSDVLTNTNAVAPIMPTWTPPPVQPVPTWLQKRGVN